MAVETLSSPRVYGLPNLWSIGRCGGAMAHFNALIRLNKRQKRRCEERGGRHSKSPSSKAMLVDAVDQHCLRGGK